MSNSAQLDTAKRVVREVMKTRGAKALFNVPVDPVALNVLDYFDVIKHPIDLGTIHKRLSEGQRKEWGEGSYYRNSGEVFEEVTRVWSNCYLYNKGPQDAPIRELCQTTQSCFERKWKEAGLEDTASNELDVPEKFSLRKETAELPVRLLDAFCIVMAGGGYVPLEQITAENMRSVRATGTLVPPIETMPSNSLQMESFSVRLGSLVDWCFQYGNLPGIWLITHHAWYKLLNPAECYAPFVSGTLHKFMMSLSLINFNNNDMPPAFLQSADSTLSNGIDTDSYSLPDEIVEMLMEDESVREGTLELMRKRSRSPSVVEKEKSAELNGNAIVADSGASTFSQESPDSPRSQQETKKAVMPTRMLRSATAEKHGAGDGHTTKNKTKQDLTVKITARERMRSRKKPRIHSPAPARNDVTMTLSELDEDDPLFDPSYDVDVLMKDDEDEDYVHGSGRRHRAKKAGESEAQRLKREKKAMEQFKRDQEADRVRGPPPAVTSHSRIPQELLGSALSCWDFFLTFHVPLEIPAFPFWRFEAALCPLHYGIKRSELRHRLAKHATQPVQDPDAKASALLLQDVHLSLCRTVQGKIPFTKDTPSHATLDTKTNPNGHWTQSTSLLLLKSSPEDVDEETRSAAAFLHGHEYLDVPLKGKLKMLHALINMVVSTDAFREHLNGQVDKLSLQKSHPYEEKPLNVAVLESVSLSFERKAANLSVEKWTNWFLAHRIGVLSSIGQDFRGSHYWVLGDYEQSLTVSAKPTRSRTRFKSESVVFWGWYEGEAIAQFIDWLQKGDLESEKPLLDTLNNIPKPVQLERNRSHSDSSTLNVISLGYHKMDKAALEVFRMDDYSDIRYPMLRGEGEIYETAHDVQTAARIAACVRALLSTIPFWEAESSLNNKVCAIMDKITNHQDAASLAKDVCSVADLVSHNGTMKEEWKVLKKEWEYSLRGCISMHGIIAHLNVFQSFVLPLSHSVHRPAFNTMVRQAKCPLYFPMPGEHVVVLKTGCLAHLERYLEVSRQTTAASETAPCFRQSMHPEFVSLAKKHAESLSPVEQFRVCCIAYRSPYADPPPEGTALAEDHGIPVLSCMWLLLSGSFELAASTTSVALPIHVDNALPDFIVKISAFEQSRRINWKAGDRFKMFFGGKSRTRGPSGIYYKGTISGVKQPVSGEAYDPWESLTVKWDNDNTGAAMKVSPWEIEVDPEEQRRLEEARVRQLDARARQARALAKQHRNEFLVDMLDGDDGQSVGDPDYDPLAEFEGGKSTQRTRRRGSALQELVYYDPKNPSGPVPNEVMAIVPGPYEFPILIHNFMLRLKGKFKCPVFSGKDLDLYKVFHEVQERGGYDVVTSLKLWKDVCRTLNVDLKGQTSASYNMRLNYEKCLLDFEHYLSSGRYTQELQNGTAPSCTIFETFPQRLREFELEALMARGSGTILEPDQIKTRGARRSRETVSMTQLLIGEAQAKDQGHRLLQKTAQKPFQFERRISPNQHKGTSQSAGGDAGRAILPPVAHGLPSEFESLKRVDYHRKDPVEIQPGESIGMALDRMGWALIGCQLWRRWPGHGVWCKAEVTDYNRLTNEYCLTVDKGTDIERVEWVDLRELEGEEVSQRDPAPADIQKTQLSMQKTTLKSPAGNPKRNELSRLLAPPRALQRFGAEASQEAGLALAPAPAGTAPMEWINQVWRTGMNSEFLKKMADDAAAKSMTADLSPDFLASIVSQAPYSQSQAVGQLASLLTEGIVPNRHKRTRAPKTDNTQDLNKSPSVKQTAPGDDCTKDPSR